jgi:hypothetical protein
LADIQAVLWMNSGSLQNADMFNSSLLTLGKALDAQRKGEAAGILLPITLWTGIRLYSPNKNEKELGVVSKGLKAFTGKELDVLPSFTTAENTTKNLLLLVSYQFQSGVLYQEGETLDIEGNIYGIHKSHISNTLSVTSQGRK